MLKEKVRTPVCQAKDPENCRYHHPQKNVPKTTVADGDLKAFFNTPTLPSVTQPSFSGRLVNRALNCSLQYEGEQPEWFTKYADEAANHPTLPTKVELVDIIDSPEGELAVIWQQDSQQSGDISSVMDSGYQVQICYLKHIETGKNLGYIKMGQINEESFKRSFGDDEFAVFRFRQRETGAYYGFPYEANESLGARNLEGEELTKRRRKVWAEAHKDFGVSIVDKNGERVYSYNITPEHAPEDEQQLLADLKPLKEEAQQKVKETLAYFGTPYVDFSRIEEPLKGKGYGTALYVYTARMLGKEGQVLRASGSQTEYAKQAWVRFKKNFPKNVKTVKKANRGKETVYSTLDFRK